jgi:hypothetical protein
VQEQRYTLALPAEIYEELKDQADRRGTTIKELVRQSLKLGLLAIKLEEDPNTGLFIKEKLPHSDSTRETRLLLI